jgi:AcrR family transcriptional regulator
MSKIKERLRSAAIGLFARQGYSNTTIDQIAAEVDASKGAFYYHFGSKDEALFAIYQPLLELQIERLREICGRDLPMESKLFAVAEDVILTCLERIEDLTVFMQSMHLLEPKTRALVRARRRDYHQSFSHLIETAQAERVVRGDMHPDLLINQLFGPLHYCTTWYNRDGQWQPAELARQMASLWIDGLRLPPDMTGES